MPPRGIGPPAGCTGSASKSDVLFERHADDHFMLTNSDNFSTSPLQIGNVFQYFGTERTVERIISKLKVRNISRDCQDSRMLERRFS